MDVDFDLQDSICDSTDLKASWEGTSMPAPLLTFLATLFKIPKHKHFRNSIKDQGEFTQPLVNEENNSKGRHLPHLQQVTSDQQKP